MKVALGIAAALVAALACASSAEPAPPATTPPKAATPTVVVETTAGKRHAVKVELARTPNEQSRGLMYRKELADDAGMLFVFPAASVHAFWMRNTLLSLDMIFISDDGLVVGIVERAQPLTETLRDVGQPSRYVLEVNGGWCAAHGVKAGDRVRFEDVLL